jgi:hypothetical protein
MTILPFISKYEKAISIFNNYTFQLLLTKSKDRYI